ncbi:ExbD/TolR family protein [Pendulispora albinea]|uniref:Biopolymer transporter ExbD n=1 Tax=Pendulispora albinea TaxID=2741071 RepID=A0ABZ2LTG7_9BACT
MALTALALALPLLGCDSEESANPRSSSAELSELRRASAKVSPDALLVYVGDDGVTFMDGEPLLTDGKIAERAQAFHAQNPRGRVIVQSHEAALHGRTVRVLELLEEAKIQHVTASVRRAASR